MRRLSILFSLALLFALLASVAATAGSPAFCDGSHFKYDPNDPRCDTTPSDTTLPPTVVECEFDNGVLTNWSGTGGLRCQWTVTAEEREMPFSFKLIPVSPDIGETVSVNLPDLQVTDVYLSGGEICFREHSTGWNDLAYSWTSFTLPATGDCGDWRTVDHVEDVFAISISVNRVRNGDVVLEYTQP
jgi:hypothetical protein